MKVWVEQSRHGTGVLKAEYSGPATAIPFGEQYNTPSVKISKYQWMVQVNHTLDSIEARKTTVWVELFNASACEVTADFIVYVDEGDERFATN